MNHEHSCSFCGHTGISEFVHGRIQCTNCKQMPPDGDCCQGAPIKGDTRCLDGEAQSKESQT